VTAAVKAVAELRPRQSSRPPPLSRRGRASGECSPPRCSPARLVGELSTARRTLLPGQRRRARHATEMFLGRRDSGRHLSDDLHPLAVREGWSKLLLRVLVHFRFEGRYNQSSCVFHSNHSSESGMTRARHLESPPAGESQTKRRILDSEQRHQSIE
jgi:hypothetical protein